MAFDSIATDRLQALIQDLQAHALSPRPANRLGVFMSGSRVGLATAEVARFLAERLPRFRIEPGALVLADADLDFHSRTDLLTDASLQLRAAGLTFAWRDEPLEIRAGHNQPVLATIERAVCRTLGITTLAVHMNALAADGRLFVAQRSATKKIDPGLWDNLVGGMVPAGESAEAALAREAWEEAGLRPGDFSATRGRRFLVDRPVPEGWMSEMIQVFDARVGIGVTPVNQDGEVGAIDCRRLTDVLTGIEAGEFTLEASLATLDLLARRAGLSSPSRFYR
ncbi:MAG: DUF4743 domain-containing protein [Burkholderiaceae bacterium]